MKGMPKTNRFTYEHPTFDIQYYTTLTYCVCANLVEEWLKRWAKKTLHHGAHREHRDFQRFSPCTP